MAAPDIRFESGGQTWTFRFGIAAWCAVEEQYDKPFMEVFVRCFPEVAAADILAPDQLLQAKFQARFTDMRAIVYAGLIHHQEGVTFSQVNEIIDDIGMDKVGELVKKSLTASQGGGGKAKTRPQRAANRSA